MVKANQDIRQAAKNEGFFLWQIGDRLGYSDPRFAKLLRKELDPRMKARIYGAIDELKRERELAEEAV